MHAHAHAAMPMNMAALGTFALVAICVDRSASGRPPAQPSFLCRVWVWCGLWCASVSVAVRRRRVDAQAVCTAVCDHTHVIAIVR